MATSDTTAETTMDDAAEEASRARAARLHAQIEMMKARAKPSPHEDESGGESPREYVERRMHEIEAEEPDERSESG